MHKHKNVMKYWGYLSHMRSPYDYANLLSMLDQDKGLLIGS